MVGTGAAAVDDAIALTRHAAELGFAGALVLPPFYYKGVPEEGVFDSFARLIDAVADDRLRLYLYHIPQMSGVPITLGLIERLLKAYPGVVAGLKDSSGNWENTHAVIRAFPEIATYSASEALLAKNVDAGGAGCISASANVQAANIVALIRALGTPAEEKIAERVTAVRKIFESLPLIPATKAAVAARQRDAAFRVVRPPFVALAAEHAQKIEDALALSAPEAMHNG
jgi:4-hydroxy-tetrahydrodipicolinate synthase